MSKVFKVVGPQGETGPQGIQGEQGIQENKVFKKLVLRDQLASRENAIVDTTYLDSLIQNYLTNDVPIGVIQSYAGLSPPDGWYFVTEIQLAEHLFWTFEIIGESMDQVMELQHLIYQI